MVLGSVRVSPDGKSVLLVGIDKQKYGEEDYAGGIYSIDIKTGMLVSIYIFNKDNVLDSKNVEWDKEGKCIFYARANHIIKRNIKTGEEKILYTDKMLSFSPTLRRSFDGTNLLFDGASNLNEAGKLKEGESYLLSIPEDGGEAEILCTAAFPGTGNTKIISISPDGKFNYFSAKTPAARSVLYRIAAAGRSPKIIWQSKDCNLTGISIHPDGKQIALSTSIFQAEISVIENLSTKVTEVFANVE